MGIIGGMEKERVRGFWRAAFGMLERARIKLSRMRSWRWLTAEAQRVSEGKGFGSWKPAIGGGVRSDSDSDFEDEEEEEEEDFESRSCGMGSMSGGVTEAGSFRIWDFSWWRAREMARRRRRVWRVWVLGLWVGDSVFAQASVFAKASPDKSARKRGGGSCFL